VKIFSFSVFFSLSLFLSLSFSLFIYIYIFIYIYSFFFFKLSKERLDNDTSSTRNGHIQSLKGQHSVYIRIILLSLPKSTYALLLYDEKFLILSNVLISIFLRERLCWSRCYAYLVHHRESPFGGSCFLLSCS